VADLGLENAQKLGGSLNTTGSSRSIAGRTDRRPPLRNGLKKAGRNFFALSDPVQHYLTATGRTLFKQLPFEDPEADAA